MHLSSLLGFALLALGMVLTPGPNMVYVVSRSVCQGRRAGLISLGGVGLAFLVYMLAAALGITSLLLAVPFAYDTLRFAGAAYLAWMAWQALKPGGRSPFAVQDLPVDSARRLFAMGFMTNLLNPKVALLYLSLLPQFIDPAAGSVFMQALVLGTIQIALSLTVNSLMAIAAGSISGFLARRPGWLALQRRLMGTMHAGLALRLALDARR